MIYFWYGYGDSTGTIRVREQYWYSTGTGTVRVQYSTMRAAHCGAAFHAWRGRIMATIRAPPSLVPRAASLSPHF